jgi:AraC-like DNA-binding protein
MKAFWETREFKGNIQVWSCCYKAIKFLSHYHREIELIYIREGHATIGINNQILEFHEGDLICCQSSCMHYSTSDSEDSILDFLIFDQSILQEYGQIMSLPLRSSITRAELSQVCMDSMCQELFYTVNKELFENNVGCNAVIASSLIKFMAYYHRYFQLNEPCYDAGNLPVAPKIKTLLAYIDKSYFEDIPLKKAAEMIGYDPSYCSKMFKKTTGIGFLKYVNSVRIEHSIDLLRRHEHTVTEISLLCGFRNIRSFNRTFHEITGTSPIKFSDYYRIAAKEENRFSDPYMTKAIVSYDKVIAGEEYLRRYKPI